MMSTRRLRQLGTQPSTCCAEHRATEHVDEYMVPFAAPVPVVGYFEPAANAAPAPVCELSLPALVYIQHRCVLLAAPAWYAALLPVVGYFSPSPAVNAAPTSVVRLISLASVYTSPTPAGYTAPAYVVECLGCAQLGTQQRHQFLITLRLCLQCTLHLHLMLRSSRLRQQEGAAASPVVTYMWPAPVGHAASEALDLVHLSCAAVLRCSCARG